MAQKTKIGALIDQLYAAQQKRLAKQREMDKQLAALAEVEAKLTAEILTKFSDEDISKAGGTTCTATVGLYVSPRIEDWPKFTKFIQRTGAFDLLEKRAAKNACRERWEQKESIPGIGQFSEKRLYLNKINKDK
jgi:hypothetical protein